MSIKWISNIVRSGVVQKNKLFHKCIIHSYYIIFSVYVANVLSIYRKTKGVAISLHKCNNLKPLNVFGSVSNVMEKCIEQWNSMLCLKHNIRQYSIIYCHKIIHHICLLPKKTYLTIKQHGLVWYANKTTIVHKEIYAPIQLFQIVPRQFHCECAASWLHNLHVILLKSHIRWQ